MHILAFRADPATAGHYFRNIHWNTACTKCLWCFPFWSLQMPGTQWRMGCCLIFREILYGWFYIKLIAELRIARLSVQRAFSCTCKIIYCPVLASFGLSSSFKIHILYITNKLDCGHCLIKSYTSFYFPSVGTVIRGIPPYRFMNLGWIMFRKGMRQSVQMFFPFLFYLKLFFFFLTFTVCSFLRQCERVRGRERGSLQMSPREVLSTKVTWDTIITELFLMFLKHLRCLLFLSPLLLKEGICCILVFWGN